MKYAVVTGTTLVESTDSEHGAIEYAVKANPDAKYIPLADEKEIMKTEYGAGKYIISDVRTATLLEKVKNVQKGYFFSSETYELKVLTVWTILDVAEAEKRNIIKAREEITTLKIGYPQGLHELNHEWKSITTSPNNNIVNMGVTMTGGVNYVSVPTNDIETKRMTLHTLSQLPRIMSIGDTNDFQYRQIDEIIKNNLTYGYLRDDNIHVITNSEQSTKTWIAKYKKCIVHEKIGEEIYGLLYQITKSTSPRNDKDKISQLVIFDNTLTPEIIKHTDFTDFMKAVYNNTNLSFIVMTNNYEVITNNTLVQKVNKIMINGLTTEMYYNNMSTYFTKKYGVFRNNTTVFEQTVANAIRKKQSIVLDHAYPTQVFTF